jgi:hypothetical protein
MRKTISEKMWLDIKTQYQTGSGIRELSRKYEIGVSTISQKKTKDNWGQVGNVKLSEAVSAVQAYEQVFTEEQLPLAREILKEELSLKEMVGEYMQEAIKLNVRNIKAINKIVNDAERINLTARAKANMVDIAVINTVVKESNIPDNKDEVIDIDSNPMEAYQRLIKG